MRSNVSPSKAMFFKARAGEKLADVKLQKNLTKARGKFVSKRSHAVADLTAAGCDFEALRQAGEVIRNKTLSNLSGWLEAFE